MSKILVIEDNEDIAGLIRDAFVHEGFEVLVCHDGYQGVEFNHRERPDVIILDLMMPAGGGLCVLEKIRLSTRTRPIPVVVLTAAKEPEVRQKAIDLGADAFLEKPYDFPRLLATVKGFLA